VLAFTNVYFFELRFFNGLRPIQIKKFLRYLSPRRRGGICGRARELALPHARASDETRVLIVGALGPGEGRRQSAHGERDGGVVRSRFGIEQARGVIERRQVPSRGVDPCLISGNRRRDLIPFAAQAEGDVHSVKLEQNRNIVKVNSELPEAVRRLSRGKHLRNRAAIVAAEDQRQQAPETYETDVMASKENETTWRLICA
jgi:hypothetical protein